MLTSGQVQLVVSEDSDLLVFGTDRVRYKTADDYLGGLLYVCVMPPYITVETVAFNIDSELVTKSIFCNSS